jgi:hypothetical protein
MAPVRIKIPGTAGIVEAKKARMDRAVRQAWNAVTATPGQKVRKPSAGNLGKRLQTARLP